MILLLDIGNTNTHVGLGNSRRVVRHAEFPTPRWETPRVAAILRRFAGNKVSGAIFCTVVPAARTRVRKVILQRFQLNAMELTARTVEGVGIDYPNPRTVGTDRLANAVAVRQHFGAPAVVIDFGTAVTFDVVDQRGNYAGGIIAPGLSAMTDYLHEKTALLPRIRIRDIDAGLGKSTEEAMLIGAVHGYRGLIRELLKRLKSDLRVRRLPVVATGGYASLIASKMTEITAVEPLLTLEGLRLVWTRRNLEKW